MHALASARAARDAVGAVLVAGALGTRAGEPVRGVVLDQLELEAGGRDVVQVAIRLTGPGDAGSPEVGLARRARGDLPPGDDVGKCEPSAGAARAPLRRRRGGLLAERLTTPFEITASNEPSSKGSSSIRARRKLTCASRRPLGLGELLGRDVDPADRAIRADLCGGREHVHAGAAAQVEYVLAREQLREAEW